MNLEENDLDTFTLGSSFNNTLTTLNLDGNKIKNFSAYSFGALQSLNLDNNQLVAFGGNNLNKLTFLSANNNSGLVSIESDKNRFDSLQVL